MAYYTKTDGVATWRRLLASPDTQWKVGKSARTLANCWESSAGLPAEVSDVFDSSGLEDLSGLELVAGFPEHKVPLPGGSRASQTDVFVLAGNERGLVSIAVEGKVNESFDETVASWLGDSPSGGKLRRLEFLCEMIRIEVASAMTLRYQLLHRTAAAILEGDRFHARVRAMVVHSWGDGDSGYRDYEAFAKAVGAVPAPNEISSTGVADLYVGWVSGDPRWLEA